MLVPQELASYLESGALTSLHVAFSRDGASKDYVQHHVEREAHEVWRLLDAEVRRRTVGRLRARSLPILELKREPGVS